MRRAVRDADGKVLRTLVFSPHIPQDIKGDDLAACSFDINGGVLVETKQPVPAYEGAAMVARIEDMAQQIDELTSQLSAAENEVLRLNQELSEATAPPATRSRKKTTISA